MGVTVISSNRSWANPLEDTATLDVKGDGFVAMDITFENTGYTVAVANDAERTAFTHCSFKGYKGVVKASGFAQFYGRSNVYGPGDVIWGTANAVFQSCAVYVDTAYFPGQDHELPTRAALTFQQRSDPSSNGGFVFQGCSVDAAPGAHQSASPPPVLFLGRPGGAFSAVVFMESYLGGVPISRAGTGWLLEYSSVPPATLYLKEYNNRGPGVGPAERRINTTEATQFTPYGGSLH